MKPRNITMPEMIIKPMETNVRKWAHVEAFAMTSRAAGDSITKVVPIPETIANQLITVTDLGRGGARI